MQYSIFLFDFLEIEFKNQDNEEKDNRRKEKKWKY